MENWGESARLTWTVPSEMAWRFREEEEEEEEEVGCKKVLKKPTKKSWKAF